MEGLAIQPYDILMLALLVLAAVLGAWKGMAWQIASLCSLVVSYMAAVQFSGQLAPYVSAQEPWNRFIAMLVIFLAVSLAVWIVFRLVAGMIDRVRLKEFDRQMGALLGLAKGVILCLVVTFFAVTLSESTRQQVLQSRSGCYTAMLIQRGSPLMPDEVRDLLGKYIDQLDRQLSPTTPVDTEPEEPEEPEEKPVGPFGNRTAAPSQQGLFQQQGNDQRPRAWDPQLWRDDLQQEVSQRAGRIEQGLDRSLDNLHQAARRAAGGLQDSVDYQLDELGRRIEERPLEPVR